MDSRTWHGSLPRRIPGERVVCSYAVTRPHYRSSDDYSELPDDVLERLIAASADVSRIGNASTLRARSVQTAVQTVVPDCLAQHAISEGMRAVALFFEKAPNRSP